MSAEVRALLGRLEGLPEEELLEDALESCTGRHWSRCLWFPAHQKHLRPVRPRAMRTVSGWREVWGVVLLAPSSASLVPSYLILWPVLQTQAVP